MRFEVGQQYVSEATPGLIAHVVQTEDLGSRASVELRLPDGTLERTAQRVEFVQFSGVWRLQSNGHARPN
jgi:hypothetical protein